MARVMEELLASLKYTSLSVQKGDTVEGKIIQLTGNEVLVDLGLKSEGLILLRDLPPDSLKNLKIGGKISAVVSELENETGQIVLGIQKTVNKKQGASTVDIDPKKWENLTKKFKDEEIIKAKVTKITQFGVFVQLEPGIEGLIHVSKLGPDEVYEVGQQVSVVIDGLDEEKKKISLSPIITSTKGLIYK